MNLETIEHTVVMSMIDMEITRELINKRVRSISKIMNADLSENDIQQMIKNIEAKNETRMELGITLVDSTYKPWLSDNRENIKWYYWPRYKQYLVQQGFGYKIVSKMDIITDEILDLMQNPLDDGAWQRKGLIVGHVQSGKTANYLGVICKALDSGYKLVIVLAGLLNSLRKQTQIRTDYGVIGLDSSLMLKDISALEKIVGVGKFSHEEQICPVSITTVDADFNENNAIQRQIALSQYAPPLVFVVKKHVKILNNLIKWLKTNNKDLSKYPMLLIDDEADHASINTKSDNFDPTKTNEKIRKLLTLFPKNVYIGYTATPFANIFINPDTPEEMMDDLFPKNFIRTLEPPTNYLGANEFFIYNREKYVREVNDYKDILPLSHKIGFRPVCLPESLKEAIRAFVLICAIRVLRNQENKHNSMMINVSRFTNVQTEIKILVREYWVELNSAICNNYALPQKNAIENNHIKDLFMTFNKEFSLSKHNWFDVKDVLYKAVSRINIIEVNSSRDAEKDIDYSARNYPKGRHLIAIGGLSLSRGLTLEGLSISYFLRRSIMYDTLMQMGRWFGYRTGYDDLCRIYMTDIAAGWYKHISEATNELRSELIKMKQQKKTPEDFGLRVRNHDEALLVTARNKMRDSKTIVRELDLTGRLIETSRLFLNSHKVKQNLEVAEILFKRLKENFASKVLRNMKHVYWTGIPYSYVMDFIESFQNHPESMMTEKQAIKDYINILNSEYDKNIWNILFVSVSPKEDDVDIEILQENLRTLNPGIRRNTEPCDYGIMLQRRKLGAGGIDRIDLNNGEIREIPLLMIHVLDCRYHTKKDKPIFPNGVVAYGISFPGEKEGRIKKLATYQVNTTWMKQQYGNDIETEEDIGGDL